jgi:hypothetical protein
MQYRDSCAHLLIPLNRCRQAEYYLPWKCEVRICPGCPRSCWTPTFPAHLAFDESPADRCHFSLCFRMNDTHTRSASTRSSRSAWLRWTSSAPPRTALAATKLVDFVICVCAVRTAGKAAGYVHRRYTETAHGPPFTALGRTQKFGQPFSYALAGHRGRPLRSLPSLPVNMEQLYSHIQHCWC